MNVLMVSAEMAPLAKVGGLADVVSALSGALAARRHDVRVVLPLYGHLDRSKITVIKGLPPMSVRVGQRVHGIRFYRWGSARAAVKVYLVECPALFSRPGVYAGDDGLGFADALTRSALHSQAALLLPRLLAWPVDVLHAHDAAAVPSIIYRQQWYAGGDLPGVAHTVLTIHNLAHQEIHAPAATAVLGLPASAAVYPGLLEFQGQLNLLKGGILAADVVNTVSPNYARETRTMAESGCGLQEMLAARGDAYTGILNGADEAVWDPARDPALAAGYTPANLSGKATCGEALRRELGLAAASRGAPLCGFVGRLVSQKGVQLLLPLLDRLVGDGFTFVILGTGERDLETAMTAAVRRHPGRVVFCNGFDEGLAHRIYAGSDVFLMPSVFEPCGLSQMYALKYGTPPIVRKTGGLADTVSDASRPDGTGFVFTEAGSGAFLGALRRAQQWWCEPDQWRELQQRGMAYNSSWTTAAAAYEDLYTKVMAREVR